MKTKQSEATKEWQKYIAAFNSGAGRGILLGLAKTMADPANRSAALLNLGVATPAQKKEIAARWNAINATTEAEAALHCQFAGLPKFRA